MKTTYNVCMKRRYRLHQITDRVHVRVGHLCSTWATVALNLFEKRSVHLHASQQMLKNESIIGRTDWIGSSMDQKICFSLSKNLISVLRTRHRFFRTSDRFFQMLASNIKKTNRSAEEPTRSALRWIKKCIFPYAKIDVLLPLTLGKRRSVLPNASQQY